MEFEAYHSVIVSFWILCAIFIVREYKQASLIKNQIDRKYLYATLAMLCAGVFFRTVNLSYPFGVFVDEAIGGYDAWCMANYGVDSHLASFPVYLKSWGSGQSAVYVYCAIPFVKLFGLSEPVFRLPMAIISCTSLLFFYHTLRRIAISKTLLFLLILIFVISPWHLMSSRWALDCNLSPNFMLIAVSFFLLTAYSSSSSNGLIYSLLGSAMLALVAYSYAISWLILPFFTVFLFSYLYKSKKLNIKQIIECTSLILFLLIPLACFAVVLLFDLDGFKLGFITITELAFGRGNETSWLFHNDKFWTFVYYVHKGLVLLFVGSDLLPWNSFPYWGQFYNILAIPFILVTIYTYIKKEKSPIDIIFILWVLSLLVVIFLIDPNVNHWNLLWSPLLFFFAKGIYIVGQKFNILYKLLYPMLCVLVVAFGFYYSEYYRVSTFAKANEYGFIKGLNEVVSFADQLPVDTIYNMSQTHFSFPFFLFYNPISPYKFDQCKKFTGDDRSVRYDYDKYCQDLSLKLEPVRRRAYILPVNTIKNTNMNEYKVYEGEYFYVLWNE